MAELSINARRVKAGYTFDPEDFRTTRRLQTTRGILQHLSINPVVDELGNTVWPEWVTDDIFNAAALLAEITLSNRGRYVRSRMG